jgi:glycosyltransferase involved in cell wall biosynthesis
VHGLALNKLLSRHYDVVWIGQTFPIKIGLVNLPYILLTEFWCLLVNYKKSHFLLIAVQYVSLDGIVAVFFKRLFKIKFVLFAVGSDVLKIREHAFAYPIIRFIIKESDFVFCASGLIEEKLKELSFASSKIKVVSSVVDLDDFEPYNGPKIYDVVTIGALDRNKNQMLLVNACELLPSVKTLIIGDGPLRKVLETESSKKKLDIVFLGNISHKQVFKELQKSRIYVHTSQSEGSPVAVLEAMFSGLPVILAENPYVRDFKNRYGFLIHVSSNSDESLANKMTEVMQNYAVERYNALQNKQRLLELIAQVSMEIRKICDSWSMKPSEGR